MLFSSQLTRGGSKPASPKENPIVQQASSVAAEAAAVQAEHELAAYQADRGTFVGATVTDIAGVTVLHAEPTTFCLQIAFGRRRPLRRRARRTPARSALRRTPFRRERPSSLCSRGETDAPAKPGRLLVGVASERLRTAPRPVGRGQLDRLVEREARPSLELLLEPAGLEASCAPPAGRRRSRAGARASGSSRPTRGRRRRPRTAPPPSRPSSTGRGNPGRVSRHSATARRGSFRRRTIAKALLDQFLGARPRSAADHDR